MSGSPKKPWAPPRVYIPTSPQLIAETAALFGCSYEEVIGERRTKSVLRARLAAMSVVIDNKPRHSLSQISRFFNRDHTTVLHAKRKIAREGVPQPPARDAAGGA